MRIFVVPRQLTVRLAVVAALVAASFLYVGIMGADTAVFGTPDNDLPIYNVATQEKKVALTFDAAWGANTTDAIIDILQGEDIYCTFFLSASGSTGTRLKSALWPEPGTRSRTIPTPMRI